MTNYVADGPKREWRIEDYQMTGLCPRCDAEVDTEKMQYCPACGYWLDEHKPWWYPTIAEVTED